MGVIIKHQGVLPLLPSVPCKHFSSFLLSSHRAMVFLKSGGVLKDHSHCSQESLYMTERCSDGFRQCVLWLLLLLLLLWFFFVVRQDLCATWPTWNVLCRPSWLSSCFLCDGHKHCSNTSPSF